VPAPERPEAVGRITVRGLRVEARHGVLPEEHARPQPFLIDLDLVVPVDAGSGDRLEGTVDYAAAAALAAEVLRGPHRDLIESLAAEIAGRLHARFPGLLGGSVTVHKPEAPVGLRVADVAVTWPLPSRGAAECAQ
jgi:dihydroneopterin aldolase